MNLARPIGGDDDDGRRRRLDGADLGNGDLEIGEHLEEIGLERLVRAVELVDEEHGGARGIALERLQERALMRKLSPKMSCAEALALALAGLGQADFDHLARIVPLIDGRRHVQALVALEADEAACKRLGQHLGDLGLAHPGFAFEEERTAELERQIDGGGQAAVRDVAAAREERVGFLDRRGWKGR